MNYHFDTEGCEHLGDSIAEDCRCHQVCGSVFEQTHPILGVGFDLTKLPRVPDEEIGGSSLGEKVENWLS